MQVAWGTGPAQSVTFTKTNTGTWQTADIPVPGLEYAGALGDGADLPSPSWATMPPTSRWSSSRWTGA